jgi:hypothetical protein
MVMGDDDLDSLSRSSLLFVALMRCPARLSPRVRHDDAVTGRQLSRTESTHESCKNFRCGLSARTNIKAAASYSCWTKHGEPGAASKALIHKRSDPCERRSNTPSSYTKGPAFFDLSSTCFPVISSDCQRPNPTCPFTCNASRRALLSRVSGED